jgi:hypothetical protein
LIATDTGRVLQLIVMEEIRPPSGVYMPDLFERVAERYAFVARPQNLAEAIANGAKFQHGRLATPNRSMVVSEIGIFNDGLIVDATNTDDAEYIMEDLVTWASATFALRQPITIIPRRFTSVITIEFETPIERALKGLSTISEYMSEAFKHTYNEDIAANLLRLSLNADPLTIPPFRNTQFFIERRIQRPYIENRYQSGAPLRTEEHIALLENIERALHGGRPK